MYSDCNAFAFFHLQLWLIDWLIDCVCEMCVIGLPQTKLGTYLENRVNSFLKRKDAEASDVTIGVLSVLKKWWKFDREWKRNSAPPVGKVPSRKWRTASRTWRKPSLHLRRSTELTCATFECTCRSFAPAVLHQLQGYRIITGEVNARLYEEVFCHEPVGFCCF